MTGTWVTEYWHPNKLNMEEFIRIFEAHFQGGKAEHKPLIDSVEEHPDCQLFHLEVPMERKEELFPFLERYAETRGMVLVKWAAANAPFCAGS